MSRCALFWLNIFLISTALCAHVSGIDLDDEYDDYDEFEVVKPAGKPGTGLARSGNEDGTIDISFVLEHSLGGEFKPCGRFSAKAAFSETQTGQKSARLANIRLSRDPFTANDREAFSGLLEQNAFYRVRVPSVVIGPDNGRRVMAALPARCLSNGGLHESFVLHADDRGQIVGLEYTLPSGECFSVDEALPPSTWSFNTMVAVRLPKEAPRLNPDFAANFGPPPNAERAANAPPPDTKNAPQSFFRKYWMYILPIGLMMLNSGGAPPEQGRGGQRSAAAAPRA